MSDRGSRVSGFGGPADRRSPGSVEVRVLAGLALDDDRRAAGIRRDLHSTPERDGTLGLDLADPALRRFGGYELLEVIGEGGSGTVFRAHQASLGREVAIKLLSAGPWASTEAIECFEGEARVAAQLEHPNIISVLETGCVEGIHYYTMRLIRGRSLAVSLKLGERFSERRAAALVAAVADAVACAQGLGVLHLDLKPANILVDQTGVPHVTDFSLARHLDGASAINNEQVSGTPSYMAPEQALANAYPLTAATDVWALGAILYELVTGRPPFHGDTAEQTLDLVTGSGVRAPHYFARGLSPDLEAIIRKCLYKDSTLRYASARALADDLARFAEGSRMGSRPLYRLWRNLHWPGRRTGHRKND